MLMLKAALAAGIIWMETNMILIMRSTTMFKSLNLEPVYGALTWVAGTMLCVGLLLWLI
jgi:hypothetical protein